MERQYRIFAFPTSCGAAALLTEELADLQDPEKCLAENVFWVSKGARWSHLQARDEVIVCQ